MTSGWKDDWRNKGNQDEEGNLDLEEGIEDPV